MKLLVVDDSELILRVYRDMFEGEGYEVISAGDGEAALRRFLEERPELVVTDCLIPKADGFKLVRSIREAENGSRTLVVMISSIYLRSSYRKVALEAGADLYLPKPQSQEEMRLFLERINELVRRRGAAAADAPARAGRVPA